MDHELCEGSSLCLGGKFASVGGSLAHVLPCCKQVIILTALLCFPTGLELERTKRCAVIHQKSKKENKGKEKDKCHLQPPVPGRALLQVRKAMAVSPSYLTHVVTKEGDRVTRHPGLAGHSSSLLTRKREGPFGAQLHRLVQDVAQAGSEIPQIRSLPARPGWAGQGQGGKRVSGRAPFLCSTPAIFLTAVPFKGTVQGQNA